MSASVSVGLAATVSALGLGLYQLAQNNSSRQQFFMRCRIGAQAFTVAAFAAGLWNVERKRKANVNNQVQGQGIEGKDINKRGN